MKGGSAGGIHYYPTTCQRPNELLFAAKPDQITFVSKTYKLFAHDSDTALIVERTIRSLEFRDRFLLNS